MISIVDVTKFQLEGFRVITMRVLAYLPSLQTPQVATSLYKISYYWWN